METVKNSLLVLAFFMFILNAGRAQNNNERLNAFSDSYTLEAEGDYSGAAEKLRAVYEEGSYELNARMGWLTYMAGNFTESIAFYQKAISLKPYALEPRFGIVLPQSALGNWNAVLKQYEDVLKIDPMNTTAIYKTGMIYYGREDYEEASGRFEKVVNLYPFDYDSVIMYAWSQFKMGKLREARVLFNKALLIRPDDESALEGLGLIQ
jgi:tetratricopeptide (TPR) repeat protein